MQATVIGAGVAGLACAVELAERGASVEVLERANGLGPQACSWYAGGMLAPECERESAEPLVAELGAEALAWWRERHAETTANGTLVVAPARDAAEIERFARRTRGFARLDEAGVATLEPDLAGRFRRGLYYAGEGHLDPRAAHAALETRFRELGGHLRLGVEADAQQLVREAGAQAVGAIGVSAEASGQALLGAAGFGAEAAGQALPGTGCDAAGPPTARAIIDCTGLAARAALPDLRGVKGEMLMLRSRELVLRRPIRLLHPRIPVYVVPRGEGLYMIGATMIESDDARRVTARSVLELLSAAYALHPAFGEAEIVEIGAQVRPAFPDNLPRIRERGGVFYVNGLFRHGFLLAPALARRLADSLLNGAHYPEVFDADRGERRIA